MKKPIPPARCVSVRLLSALSLLCVSAPALAQPSEPPLLDQELPSAGRRELVFEVKAFGRYALTTESKEGVALELVDKARGPAEQSGNPGSQDGRLDVFLDQGRFKLVLAGPPRSKGQARIRVRRALEQNLPRPPLLSPGRMVESRLEDHQQRSYWLDVQQPGRYLVEAAGRHLADMRVFADGTWLVDAAPSLSTRDPLVGKPLAELRLELDLQPGLYLLCLYGGPGQAWAQEDGARPLYLRLGIPALPQVVRRRMALGPTGQERFLTSAAYHRVELAEGGQLALESRAFDPPSYVGSVLGAGEITKKSVPPVAEIHTQQSRQLLTITGAPGQTFVLQSFSPAYSLSVPPGQYWFSTVHSGAPEDSLDVTGYLLPLYGNAPQQGQLVELDARRGYRRRFNLLETATLFVRIRDKAKYRFTAAETPARFVVEPLVTSHIPNYRRPDPVNSGTALELDPGTYVVTIVPEKKGITELSIAHDSLALSRLVGGTVLPPLAAGLRFSELSVSGPAVVHWNQQPGVVSAPQLRALPLDLTEPLFVSQAPGEELSVRFTAQAAGKLTALAEDGRLLSLALDGAAEATQALVSPGGHEVRLKNDSGELVQYSLGLVGPSAERDLALPPLPDARAATLPKLPELTAGPPAYFDLARQSSRSFLLKVRSPVLHRLETTGLLATAGKLRTRMIPLLVEDAENGVGRNFLSQQYLATGDYLFTVETRGETAGHLGVALGEAPSVDGGLLPDGVPARATLPVGTALVYRFEVPRTGSYELVAMGVERILRCRLEDADGWPVITPNSPADLRRELRAGKYRLVILPEAVDVRTVTLVRAVKERRRYEGPGPHELSLDERAEKVWVEAKRGEKQDPESRRPDVWRFELPAPAEVSIELTQKMHGDLLRVGAGDQREKAAYVPPLRGYRGKLPAGRYQLEVRSLVQGSDLRYALAVRTMELMEGLSRRVDVPVALPVSVAREGLLEISSYGAKDVRARLEDEAGRMVAVSDDRLDDWNFHLAGRLAAGRYLLRLDPVGARKAFSVISVSRREEQLHPELRMPATQRVAVEDRVQVFPLAIPAEPGFLQVSARSPETVGLALEVASSVAGPWAGVALEVGRPARLELPVGGARKHYRLRLWSVDQRRQPVELSVRAPDLIRLPEDRLAQGTAQAGVVQVALAAPGLFRVEGGGEEVRVVHDGTSLARPTRGALISGTWGLYLVNEGGLPVKLARQRLGPERRLVELRPEQKAEVDVLADYSGPVLVEVGSRGPQPVVSLGGDLAASAVSRGAAAAVALTPGTGTQLRARVQAGEGTADSFELLAQARSFAAAEARPWPAGAAGRVAKGAAVKLALPPGEKRLSLALEPELFAVLATGGKPERSVWAGDRALVVDSAATELWLLNPRLADKTYAVEAVNVPTRTSVISLARRFEWASPRAGVRLLEVEAPQRPARLQVRGAEVEATLFLSNGTVLRGKDLSLAAGGRLELRHGPGLALAWVEAPGASSLFGAAPAERAVSTPAEVALSGPALALRLGPGTRRALHLRTSCPVVVRFEPSQGAAETELQPAGAALSFVLPAGGGRLLLQALSAPALSGVAELTDSPVQEISEGLGPELLLPPGATRFFSFRVRQKGAVGIGARSDSPGVEAALFGPSGAPLGDGVVRLAELEPGEYLLGLSAPRDGGPARARPAVVGLEPPSRGPPPEVVEQYSREEVLP